MEIRWAKSSTKHRISRERSGHVVNTTETIIREPAPEDSPLEDDRIVFLGLPEWRNAGSEAIESDQGLLIIHAMKMRPKYRSFLKGKRDA